MIVTVESRGSSNDCKRYQALHKPIIPPPKITICCGDEEEDVDILTGAQFEVDADTAICCKKTNGRRDGCRGQNSTE